MRTCAFCNACSDEVQVEVDTGLCFDCSEMRRRYAVTLAANLDPGCQHNEESRTQIADWVYLLAEALAKRDLW